MGRAISREASHRPHECRSRRLRSWLHSQSRRLGDPQRHLSIYGAPCRPPSRIEPCARRPTRAPAVERPPRFSPRPTSKLGSTRAPRVSRALPPRIKPRAPRPKLPPSLDQRLRVKVLMFRRLPAARSRHPHYASAAAVSLPGTPLPAWAGLETISVNPPRACPAPG